MKIFKLEAPLSRHPTRSIICVTVLAETFESARRMAERFDRMAGEFIPAEKWRQAGMTPLTSNPSVVDAYLL